MDEGILLMAGKKDDGALGRKPMILRINPDGCFSMGIRFNARCVTGAVINLERKLLYAERILIPDGADTQTILNALKACIRQLINKLGAQNDKLEGIGIGTPGVIDMPSQVVKRYIHVQDWYDVPLRELMQESIPWPVSIEHGVKCTAHALRMRPEYQQAKNLLLVQMDRGVNMCMILNGHLYHGSTNISGEIGHVCAVEGGLPCACGQAGCLETVASDQAILEQARQRMLRGELRQLRALVGEEREVTIEDVVRSCELGDSEACKLLHAAGTALAKALAPLFTVMNPDHLIVSGVPATSPAFQGAFLQTIQNRTLRECLEAIQIKFEAYDELFNAVGAAELPLIRRFSVREVL